jgi:outer membrane biosynthesis protein TonB
VRTAFFVSFGLHAVVVVVAYVGLPHLFQAPEPIDYPIVVELVTIAEVTHAAKVVAKAKPKPQIKPKPKKPAPEKVVKLPLKPSWKPKPPPKPKKRVVKKPPPPKPLVKPLVKKPKAKRKFDPTRIAALLDKTKREKASLEKQQPAEKPAPPKRVSVVSRNAALSSSAPMTISEVDAVRYKIEKCWIVPAGARDAENLIVRIRITLNQDGTIRGSPEIVERSRMNRAGQQFFRIAAESARRAVLKCQPYDMLPQKKYERWREIELTFNPKEMLGG